MTPDFLTIGAYLVLAGALFFGLYYTLIGVKKNDNE